MPVKKPKAYKPLSKIEMERTRARLRKANLSERQQYTIAFRRWLGDYLRKKRITGDLKDQLLRLTDKSAKKRAVAAVSLSSRPFNQRMPREAVRPLIYMLKHEPDRSLARWSALRSLGLSKDRRAIKPVLEALAEEVKVKGGLPGNDVVSFAAVLGNFSHLLARGFGAQEMRLAVADKALVGLNKARPGSAGLILFAVAKNHKLREKIPLTWEHGMSIPALEELKAFAETHSLEELVAKLGLNNPKFYT